MTLIYCQIQYHHRQPIHQQHWYDRATPFRLGHLRPKNLEVCHLVDRNDESFHWVDYSSKEREAKGSWVTWGMYNSPLIVQLSGGHFFLSIDRNQFEKQVEKPDTFKQKIKNNRLLVELAKLDLLIVHTISRFSNFQCESCWYNCTSTRKMFCIFSMKHDQKK